jgi:predicted transcriptional regulator
VGQALRRNAPSLVFFDPRSARGPTPGRKTAISLPERIFREAERFARRTHKSRIRLYAESIAEYLARDAPDEVTEWMNQVCERLWVTANEFSEKAAWSLSKKECRRSVKRSFR